MSRSREGRGSAAAGRALGLALVLLAPRAALAGVDLHVSGSASASGEFLDVRVDLENRGDAKAAPVTVEGELLGRHDLVRLDQGIGPGRTGSALLRYPLEIPRPGTHALTLLLEYTPAGGGSVTQRAYLLLALGGNPAPAVRLSLPEASVDVLGALPVGLESADGTAHRVRLRVLTPRGLRADSPEDAIAVPAAGRVSPAVPVYRIDAPRGSTQGVLVVAEAMDGLDARTTVETGVVRILPDRAWMPRLRRPLLALAAVLVFAALVAELLRLRA